MAGTHVAILLCPAWTVALKSENGHENIMGQKGLCDPTTAVQVHFRDTGTCNGSHCTHDVAGLPQVFFSFSFFLHSTLFLWQKTALLHLNLKRDSKRTLLLLFFLNTHPTQTHKADTHSSSYFTFQLSFDPQSSVHCNYASFCSLLVL